MKAAERVQWLVNRLRTMNVKEVLFRLGRSAQARYEWALMPFPRAYKTPDFKTQLNNWVSPPQCAAVEDYTGAADKVLDGQQRLLWKEVSLSFPPDWTSNPVSQHKLPQSFGKLIDYRQTDVVGDIKYFWVLNRHHQTLVLAQAYALTKEEKYIQGVDSLLRSWIDANPYPRGANWTSSLELAIRLINWSAVFVLCGGIDGPLFKGAQGSRLRADWMQVIYQHGHFIRGHLSRHSSANNHLIGELAGLFVAAHTWPYWDSFSQYAQFAQAELEKEVRLQVTDDGVSREQTLFYEHFVLEFLLSAGLVGAAGQQDFSSGYWARIKGLLQHLAAVRSVTGNVPAVGDGDDALVLPLTPDQREQPFAGMLRLGALLFDEPGWLPREDVVPPTADWLVPDAQSKASELRSQASNSHRRKHFPQGGYAVIGDGFGKAREVISLVDVGDLGYLSIAAHGHADALAMTLDVAGHPFLIDPGTYSYQSDKQWRDYFRSTAAHNTVLVDGKNQAEIGGKFMWLTSFRGQSEVYSSDTDKDVVQGSHDGYLRLADPVVHRRKIVFVKKQQLLTVEDTLEAQGEHDITRHWHFGPGVEVKSEQHGLTATIGPIQVRLTCEDGDLQLLRGSTEPISGWYSPRFGEKEPIWTAAFHAHTQGPTVLTTQLQIFQSD